MRRGGNWLLPLARRSFASKMLIIGRTISHLTRFNEASNSFLQRREKERECALKMNKKNILETDGIGIVAITMKPEHRSTAKQFCNCMQIREAWNYSIQLREVTELRFHNYVNRIENASAPNNLYHHFVANGRRIFPRPLPPHLTLSLSLSMLPRYSGDFNIMRFQLKYIQNVTVRCHGKIDS